MIAKDYGLSGAIVRRMFSGGGNDYMPGNVLSPEDMAKMTAENRFHLVRAGYIELNEDQGETLTGDIQRLKEDNDKLRAYNEELKSEIEKWKKECDALRTAIHGPNDDSIDRNALKKKADELGIEYQKNIKTDKLIALIDEKEAGEE